MKTLPRILLLAFLLSSLPSVLLAQYNWQGFSSNQWSYFYNWSTYVVPGPGDVVNIFSGGGDDPILDVDATVADLYVASGATLTIPSGRTLTVTGSLQNDGFIVVNPGGSLVQTSTSVLVPSSGTYRVNLNQLNGVSFISSPIPNYDASGFATSPSLNGSQLVPSSINPCNPDSIAANSPYGNLLELRENASPIGNCAQSLWYVKSSGSLTPGRGYSSTAGPQSINFDDIVLNDGAVTYSGLTRQSGSIDQQDGSSSSRGWHLVGNPYPSPITLSGAQLTAMGFDAQVQLYDGSTGNWVTPAPTLPVTIAVGQGFQIRKTNVGGTSDFSLDNTFRTGGNPTFYKQAAETGVLNITLNGASKTDRTQVYFLAGATADFDPLYDANKLMGNYYNPMLYTVAADERLSYNALPELAEGTEVAVPLGVHRGVEGSFTLTFNDIATLGADVALEDLKLGTTTPLTDGQVYSFTSAEGEANERFVLHFNKTAEPTGINGLAQQNVKLYPNPSSGNVTLQLPQEHGYTQAQVIDATGKTVAQVQIASNGSQYRIDTEKFEKGVYCVRLVGANQTALVKFIKI
ncbi:MAG: T9SS type A sorting domain-containing protein [Chitinophagales bacterium]|nr:T9SS type A sorting domain-containing protein [Chitinophagales bacterium]